LVSLNSSAQNTLTQVFARLLTLVSADTVQVLEDKNPLIQIPEVTEEDTLPSINYPHQTV
jgi:hypothetical protein